jgi:hypothetical protein
MLDSIPSYQTIFPCGRQHFLMSNNISLCQQYFLVSDNISSCQTTFPCVNNISSCQTAFPHVRQYSLLSDGISSCQMAFLHVRQYSPRQHETKIRHSPPLLLRKGLICTLIYLQWNTGDMINMARRRKVYCDGWLMDKWAPSSHPKL